MSKKRIKVYELYPTSSGYTVMSRSYHGSITAVSAVSVSQALYFAYNETWADAVDRPLGIIWRYVRGTEGGDHLIFTGERAYNPKLTPHHGDGVTAIRSFMQEHKKHE